MVRLWVYLALLFIVAVLAREAATWVWTAYNAPIVTAGIRPPAAPLEGEPRVDAPVTKAPELDQPTLTAFPQTSSRPVFFEGRRYPSKDAAKKPVSRSRVKPPSANVKELKLLGVSIKPGIARALIAIGDKPPKWVDVGETIMKWTVRSVNANDVVLERNGQTAALKLYGS